MYQSYNANADISTVIIYFSLRTGLLCGCNAITDLSLTQPRFT